MKISFLLLVVLHGLIHLLGFIKGYGIREVQALTLPISRTMGLLWLMATALFLLYAVMHFTNANYAWLAGILAVALSQILVLLFWKDAKFGTVPNVIILLVCLVSLGHFRFQQLVEQETSRILAQNNSFGDKIITEEAVKDLPEPVKNWLRSSGALGKPFVSVGKVLQKASMKMKPDQNKWMTASAVQYTTLSTPAFIWTVDAQMNSILGFQGRDKFDNGKGEMLIKLNSLVNVVNAKGEKLDEGSLQRYLGEMVWFPSLALSPYITWEQVNDTTAKATMNYKGTSGSGTFYFNAAGDFTRFSAMRYQGNEPDAKRHEWIMSVQDYKVFEGIKVPSKMTATWKLDAGDWTWLELEIVVLRYDERR
ncbi:MAG: hypothetical protein IT261_07925 [Saprospiraceae bacterium]|nr:hypothetical protein [Saprospiraceae bacterium]